MTLNLTASTVAGATYNWSGPNGFAFTNQNPSITNAATNLPGLFSVTVATGGCTSAPATTLVTVNPQAKVTIQPLGNNIILSWPAGTLQSATNITGPWGNVGGAAPPRTNPASLPAEFFRTKLQ